MKNFYLPVFSQTKHYLIAAAILWLSLLIFTPAVEASTGKPVKRHGQKTASVFSAPTISYATPQTYSINQTISPLTPASSGVAALAYSTTPVGIGGSFNAMAGPVVDASGNLYVVDPSRTAIDEIPANGNPEITIGTGFTSPEGLAVDASGNVYVADTNNNTVFEILAGSRNILTIDANLRSPAGVAVDAAGNVYVADAGDAKVYKISPGGTVKTIGSGFGGPTGVAVDAAGYIYVADYGRERVDQISPDGNTIILYEGAPNAGFSFPTCVAVDAAGNLYVADQGSHQIVMIPAGNGVPVVVGPIGTPSGVAVDTKGVVYIGDSVQGTINKIAPVGGFYLGNVLPAGLAFNNSTGVISGTPTVLSPAADYLVTAYNSSGGTSTTVNLAVTPPFIGLTALALSDGTLSPAFAPTTTAYTDSVTNASATITITPTVPPGETITINGTTVTSGSPTAPLTLGIGSNPFNIVVTGSDGVTTKTYNLHVVWTPSSEAHLAGLVVNTATLSPAFASNVFNYTASVPASTSSVTITPSLLGAAGHITVNSIPVANNGTTAPISLNSGTNTINVVVTAQDNTTNLSYTVVITRAYDATLSALSFSAGALSPAFAPGTTTYTPTYGNLIQSTTVTPTATDPASTITVNGTTVTSGTASAPIALTEGRITVITVVVTAADGTTTDTYYIQAYRLPSSLATLSAMKISHGTLTPAFNPSTGVYSAMVTNASLTITPTTADANASVTVNGTDVESGKASGAIALAVGSNTITIVVTAQNGTTRQTYRIIVIRPSTNAKLAGLTISAGNLAPAFTGNTNSYTVSEPYGQTSLSVTPTVAVTGGTVTVNGTAVTSGSTSGSIALNVGSNNITIVVTAQDGVTANTYTVNATRAAASTNDGLSALTISKGTLSAAFSTAAINYADTVTNGTTSLTVTPTLADATATVTVNGTTIASGHPSGAIALAVGTNTISAVVSAQSGASKTYTVTVIRPSTNAKLAALHISSGTLTPAFNTNTAAYTASVTGSVASITLTPTVAVAGATVKVNGTTVASGVPSAAIALSVGGNVITTVVTAQDGVTTSTYTVTVTRAALSSNANLANLTLSKGTLSPAFAAATTAYADLVTNGTTSITLTPTTADVTASVTVNGISVASGKASGAIALVVGNNTITTIVTAADGTTEKTYTVNVIRPSTNAKLSALALSSGTLTPKFNTNTVSYSDTVVNTTASVTITPTVAVTGATVTVNGAAVTSGVSSAAVALSVGNNTITTVVTAQDGTTTDTYTITVIRLMGVENIPDATVGVDKPVETPRLADDRVTVHQAISPNGDGINDFLQIDNISNYPDNNLKIMNHNGMLVYEAKGYDNATKVFDGHSNKNGQMQLPGTYFYQLEYTVNGIAKQKTGFVILKY